MEPVLIVDKVRNPVRAAEFADERRVPAIGHFSDPAPRSLGFLSGRFADLRRPTRLRPDGVVALWPLTRARPARIEHTRNKWSEMLPLCAGPRARRPRHGRLRRLPSRRVARAGVSAAARAHPPGQGGRSGLQLIRPRHFAHNCANDSHLSAVAARVLTPWRAASRLGLLNGELLSLVIREKTGNKIAHYCQW